MASTTNANTFQAVKDTDSRWQRMAYGVNVGSDYSSYREALVQQMSQLLQYTSSQYKDKAAADAQATKMLKANESGNWGSLGPDSDPDLKLGGQSVNNPYQYKSPSVSDASVGGNDAINPYCAFGVDDDIVHDISRSKDGGYLWGMGRCYSEMYETKQQILYLTMGMPKFRNLQTWLQNACNKEMAEMNDVGSVSLTTALGTMLKNGIALAIQLPWLPIKWACSVISSIKDYKVTEYFYFRDNMPLYYKYVNTLLSEIAVGMGIYGNDTGVANGGGNANDKGQPNNGSNINSSMLNKYRANLPAIMQGGPDIFKIMSRRSERLSGSVTSVDTDKIYTDSSGKYQDLDKKKKQDESVIVSGLKSFWTGLTTGALEGMNFIGFRIEKAEVANESFSNSTGDSPLLQTLNGEVAANREKNLGAVGQGTGVMAKALGTFRKVQDFKNRVTEIATGKSGVEATVAYVAAGNGYFDLPQQWTGSSGCTRNISFNMKLRAKTGGDNVSIYQSIMIPLSCIMAAALPRAVGDSTYTSPFIIRAFCKGMFSIPAGIIQSLSITRGSGEFGWSLSRLPTVVDVSFTIQDLSPMLFLSMAGGEGALAAISQAFANNTKMHEYINTLTGIGAKERYYQMGQLKRRLSTAMLIAKNTTFSATYRGYVMGDSSIIRSMMAITPWTRVKNN